MPSEDLRRGHVRIAWRRRSGGSEADATAQRQTKRRRRNAEPRVVIGDPTLPNGGGDRDRPGSLDRMYATWPRPEGRDHEEAQTQDER
jgi:hypothetical protein